MNHLRRKVLQLVFYFLNKVIALELLNVLFIFLCDLDNGHINFVFLSILPFYALIDM